MQEALLQAVSSGLACEPVPESGLGLEELGWVKGQRWGLKRVLGRWR